MPETRAGWGAQTKSKAYSRRAGQLSALVALSIQMILDLDTINGLENTACLWPYLEYPMPNMDFRTLKNGHYE